jgi:ABC-type nitrate/sulfonate/bicarbonate transport system permease component
MFAAILLTSALSIALVKIIELIERRAIPWQKAHASNG